MLSVWGVAVVVAAILLGPLTEPHDAGTTIRALHQDVPYLTLQERWFALACFFSSSMTRPSRLRIVRLPIALKPRRVALAGLHTRHP